METLGWIFVIYILLGIFYSPMDDTDKSFFKRSGLVLYTDHKTGLQYIKGGLFGNMIPRLDQHGRHMKEDDSSKSIFSRGKQ